MMAHKNAIPSARDLIDHYQHEGLYLIFNGTEVDISRKAVEQLTPLLERDESLISLVKRSTSEFKTCSVCPAHGQAAMCHALPAIIPFIRCMKTHMSYDSVVAIYVDKVPNEAENVLHMAETSLSRAMQYVAIESMIWHCETGRLFFKYFAGVLPFCSASEISERIYANVMLEKNGNAEAVDELLQQMRETLMIVMQCQMRRVALVAGSDVFANAFVNLYMALEMLSPEMRGNVRKRIAQRTVQPGQ